MQDIIKVTNLVKTYKMYDKPIDRLKEAINPKKVLHKDFYALKDITFTISKGETVGIIGKNGSGKSTLLKILTEVLTPTSGEAIVDGKVSALLELGAGFNPEYTGIQNIYLNGSVLGFDKKQMDGKLQEILDFAELGDFIYQPVKTYSSGMFVRLAFAVAINVDPDILIIDEALSVGDIRFQQKCFRKIEEFKKKKTVIFVSHDMSTIINHCERAIWINEGELLADGDPVELSKRYRAFMMNLDSEIISYDDNEEEQISELGISFNSVANLEMFGDLKAEITGVSLQDVKTDQGLTVVEPQQKVRLLIKCKLNQKIDEALIVGFTIKDRLGNIVT
ncbi:ATP-binding cassette domain-containing protein, partial [Turicibacter sanguinis]|nr:ATP-binding cassette domain-containing protein [Turicibacter sanguinis]